MHVAKASREPVVNFIENVYSKMLEDKRQIVGFKSNQTIDDKGELIQEVISEVKIHYPTTHQDERGTLCEIYNRTWGFSAPSDLHAYVVTVRPGKAKGWAVHKMQTDVYFFFQGISKLVLYDNRGSSCTHRMINELFFSEANRALVSIPPGIFHAIEAVGEFDSVIFNLPSHPYNHKDPDKYILPLSNDLIPYSFDYKKGF